MSHGVDHLLLPTAALAVAAWFVPRLIAKALPEGVKPLMLNAFLSVVAMSVLSALVFVVLYVSEGMPWSELVNSGVVDNVYWFGRLGLSSAIIWGPIMVLSVANLPRGWVKEVW